MAKELDLIPCNLAKVARGGWAGPMWLGLANIGIWPLIMAYEVINCALLVRPPFHEVKSI
jgi:hypothetical protein